MNTPSGAADEHTAGFLRPAAGWLMGRLRSIQGCSEAAALFRCEKFRPGAFPSLVVGPCSGENVNDSLIDQLLVSQAIDNCPKLTELTRYEAGLAAGVGMDIDFDDAGEPFYLYSSRLVDRADSVFVVNGESMEPEYHDGDMVLVERIPGAPDLQYGEIGAFFVENEPYIKVFEKDGLHSLNPEYPPMLAENYEAVYVIGRVIGTVDRDDIPTESEVKQYIELYKDEE